MASSLAHGRMRLLVGAALCACIATSCNRLWDWSLGPGKRLEEILPQLDKANRLVIKRHDQLIRETDNDVAVKSVISFQAIRHGWVSVSGAGGEYDILLVENDRWVGRVGLTATSTRTGNLDTLTAWQYFRRAPAVEVAAFAKRLDVPSPPPVVP